MLKSRDRSRSKDVSRPIFDGLGLGLKGSGLGLVSVSKAVVSVSMFLVSVSRFIVGIVAGNASIF